MWYLLSGYSFLLFFFWCNCTVSPFRNCFSSIQSCLSLSHPQAESEVLVASCQLGQQRAWREGGRDGWREGGMNGDEPGKQKKKSTDQIQALTEQRSHELMTQMTKINMCRWCRNKTHKCTNVKAPKLQLIYRLKTQQKFILELINLISVSR